MNARRDARASAVGSESDAFRGSYQATQDTLHKLRVRVLLTAIVAVAIVVALVSIFLVKQDQKESTTQADAHSTLTVVQKIRDSQLANLARTNAATACTATTGDDLITDIVNAFIKKDTNPADYLIPKPCVLPPLPMPTKAKR